MPLCGKKNIKTFETRFMTYCVKGLQANDIDQLNQLWQEAEEKGALD